MVSLEFSKSDGWRNDDVVALHPFPAAEHYARRLNPTCLYDCTKVSRATVLGTLSRSAMSCDSLSKVLPTYLSIY